MDLDIFNILTLLVFRLQDGSEIFEITDFTTATELERYAVFAKDVATLSNVCSIITVKSVTLVDWLHRQMKRCTVMLCSDL